MRRVLIGGCDGETIVAIPDNLHPEAEALLALFGDELRRYGGGCAGHFEVEPVEAEDCQTCGHELSRVFPDEECYNCEHRQSRSSEGSP